MRPFSDPLPLRLTTVWGGFRESKPIPHRYGNTGGELIQYDQPRRLFVWADHACEAIDAVLVDGIAISAWAWRNGIDSTGHPVTFVELVDAPADGVSVIARGRGKQHPGSGVLMENPAAVIWDILANLAGNLVNESTLQAFALECDARGLRVGGSIETADSVQTVIRSVCASSGAIFSPDSKGLCRIHPGGTPGVVMETIDRRFSTTATARRDSLVTALNVNFDFEAGRPKQSIQLEAPDAIALYGKINKISELRWITSARVSVSIGKAILTDTAQPRWSVRSSGIRTALAVGDTVEVQHPIVPQAGLAIVLNRSLDLATGLTSAEFEWIASSNTRVVLVQQSVAFVANRPVSAAVQTQGSDRILTLVEQDGRPIANATVTLDGQTTRYTDSAGRVEFPVALMPPGNHSLSIVTQDGRTYSETVLIA